MRRSIGVRGLFVVVAAIGGMWALGCAPHVCDRSGSLDLSQRVGDCGFEASSDLLGPKAQCTGAVAQCTDEDLAQLGSMYDCLEKLPACSVATADSWASSLQSCYAKAELVSSACAEALFGGALPGGDAGVDAGSALPPHAITDGGNGVELVVVADDDHFALAWSTRQPGAANQWEVHAENAAGVKSPQQFVEGSRMTFEEGDVGSGKKRTFFVSGLNADGQVVVGTPLGDDAGTTAGDAGTCSGPFQCSIDQVCDLGTCRTQACQDTTTCPSGYLCLNQSHCQRTFGSDGGVVDAGAVDVVARVSSLPFLSNPVTATTGKPKFGAQRFVSPFVSHQPALVALDSARQFLAMEQENQLFGHYTSNRGRSFSSVNIDTIGSRIRLAYQRSQGVLFACYNVGYGTRVRVSMDQGRSWLPTALNLEAPAPADGGIQDRVHDCDIAPWRDGHALLVTVEGDSLRVRTVSADLQVQSEETVFVSSPENQLNVFDPRRPVLATLPEEHIAHLGFTASRTISNGRDTEVYGLYRDATTGTFISTGRLNDNGVSSGNPFPQDYVSLTIEPKSKRAVAAFSSAEVSGGVTYTTVYLALFNSTTQTWGTGSDLTVFYRDAVSKNYLVFCDKANPPVCERGINDDWDAFSPHLGATRDGRILLTLLAGPQQGGSGAEYRVYAVPFDFNVTTPANPNVKGWFVPQAIRGGTSRSFDPKVGGGVILPTLNAMAMDSQISAYVVYVEGVGAAGENPNRGIMLSYPE